ncbi:MAG TPA: alpha/beta hydrolase-fold protein, partial [Candidatus Nanopelagicales bacterium]|nr:alpha/beta hydrolase-fold protein [Candidatus Nanopelagicales bacterium]
MISRRQILTGLGSLALPACRGEGCAASAAPSAAPWKELAFEPGADAPDGQRALLLTPEGAAELPVLVALHGRGESVRGKEAGARGWRDDYRVDRLLRRLRAPPLAKGDLENLIEDDRLVQLNTSLKNEPFRGLVLATPFTPDPADRSLDGARPFARFVVERLLPRVRAEAKNAAGREATGIDGVSLGGRLALLVGFLHPEVFGAVGALQPAIRLNEAPMFAGLAKEATRKKDVSLRLVSSELDPFLPAIKAFSRELRKEGVAHEMYVTPGPHDYVWNRGPGGAEMLL